MFMTTLRLLCIFPLTLGALMAASSPSWLTAWFGLELNLLSFIPLIANSANIYSSESALKYFLIQALGSALILASASLTSIMSNILMLFLILAISLKMGAAPFHFWLPPVLQGVSWSSILILTTIQKIAPLLLLSQLMIFSNTLASEMIKLFSMLSALIGSIGGMNQTLLKKIMAYSSISHMGWMLAALYSNQTTLLFYILMYSIIVSSAVVTFTTYQLNHFQNIYLLSNLNSYMKLSFFCVLFSLGGLPPFLGFIPKILVMFHISFMSEYIWLSILLMGTIISLFYYIKLFIVGMSPTSFKSSPPLLKKNFNPSFLVYFLNIAPIFNMTLFFIPF